MRLVLDAGALLAVERGDREIAALLKRELLAGRVPLTHGGVVAQVWRGGSGRQARLARLLPGVDVTPLDDALGRRAGVLLGRARGTDAVDAAVIAIAADGDIVLTSDPDHLRALAEAAAVHIDIVRV
jgi:PIN domain nuclease of toxin-antitoxin system